MKPTTELQELDCNCNDCFFMVRDFDRRKSFDHLHEGQINASHRINYGRCAKKDKDVSFIPNTISIDNQQCFKHRKTNTI